MVPRLALAVAAGMALNTAFGPHRWWLAVLGFAGLCAALDGATGRLRGLTAAVFAASWFVPLISWIGVLGRDAWVLLAVLCVLPWLAVGVATDVRTWRGGVVLAAVAVLIEWVRAEVPWGGFPWGLVAYSQVDGPLAQWSRVGGDALVTFIVVLLGSTVYRMVRVRRGVVGGIGLVGLCAAISLMPSAPVSGQLSVAAIQGNVPRLGYDDVTQAQAVFDQHVAETQRLAGSSTMPDLVVWPENAADSDPRSDARAAQRVTALAAQLGRPILVGALLDDEGEVGPTNSGLLWLPDGTIAGRYDKNHLVPFGEYLPLRDLLAAHISRFDQIPVDMRRGDGPGVMPLRRADGTVVRLGDVICFEVAYDDHLRASVRAGAQILTVQSNNATYAYTAQPAQQLAITRLRAIEHQRSAVVATTTGDSALIGPNGEVLATAPRMTAATLTGRLPTVDAVEPVDRTWPMARLVSLSVCAAAVRTRRRREME